jgi:hypothetical protein
MSIKELIQELKGDRELAGLFRGSGASGGGATPPSGSSGGGGRDANPFLDGSWNLTKQSQLHRADPGEFNRLRKEAAAKEPEGRAARMMEQTVS